MLSCKSNGPSDAGSALTVPNFTEAQTAPYQRHLNWMGHWKDEDIKEKLVQDTRKVFSFLHQDMEINLKFPSEIPEIGQIDPLKTARYIAKMIKEQNYSWDVICMDDLIYYYVGEELGTQFWGKEHLYDFSQLEDFVDSQKDFIPQGRDYRPKTGGILVGPYIEGYLYLLWYNKVVADKIGLNIQPRGLSFATFLDYVRQAHTYNMTASQPVEIILETNDLFSINLLFQNLVVSKLKYTDTLRNRLSNLKKTAILETFEAIEALGRYRPISAHYAENHAYESTALPLQDRILFYPHETGMYSHWRAIDPTAMLKMIPIELPAFGGKSDSVLGGYRPTWAVLKNAPNRDAGIQLLRYMASPRMAEKWILYTKNPTGLKGNLLTLQMRENIDIWTKFHIDMNNIYGSRVRFSANTAYLLGDDNYDRKDDLEQFLLLLITGKITAQEAYSTFMGSLEQG